MNSSGFSEPTVPHPLCAFLQRLDVEFKCCAGPGGCPYLDSHKLRNGAEPQVAVSVAGYGVASGRLNPSFGPSWTSLSIWMSASRCE